MIQWLSGCEGSLLHGCQHKHTRGSDDGNDDEDEDEDDDDDDLPHPFRSQTGIHAVFQTFHLLCTRRGVELIKTESRIHT